MSSRRSNDGGGKQLSAQSAGATAHRDLEIVETEDVDLYRCICEERPGEMWHIHANDQQKRVVVIGCQAHTERLAAEMRIAGFAAVHLRGVGECPEWE